ncbi:SDR family oxidoreductase [Winogradskyella sp. DF17]|uniref:SDR family oxidoreductase n=1 Tax=Winogradskyella pelagia TaxID=2819984 RepID=A0ABS3T1Z4_9FLAO|nr:SDR family NAD(P)-dependent oxidoreductase [Winogradskyella sp. DF17]MBO3116464.1 SDR family oxidoreductase [Winogradskyella sp. DF17]
MDLNLKGKNAIITGGSKGIGKSIALILAQEGANVAICARGEDTLKNTAAEIEKTGVRVYSQTCDVGSSDELESFLINSKRHLGSVDILVHNASALALGPTLNDWKASIDVDLMGAVNACNTVIPWMTEAGGGSILLVSSTSGLECDPTPDYGYTAAKAALIAYAKKLAVMHAPQNIRANAIAPGSTEFEGGVWDMIKKEQPDLYDMAKSMIPAGRLGTPDEVADVAVFLSSSRASWITGECVSVDGAQHRGMR